MPIPEKLTLYWVKNSNILMFLETGVNVQYIRIEENQILGVGSRTDKQAQKF
ncbi:MAG: hypothetical protein VKN72_20830 [Nostocales cyanobacterium 94392]|nr:hypothetical protein [Nostocales cyanobacterium 94392]